MARTLDWIREHAWVGAVFCLGILFGLLICMPLVPWQLPESTANILGAALGSVVAVWGAAWMADRKDRRRGQLAHKAVSSLATPLLADADLFLRQLGVYSDNKNKSVEYGHFISRSLLEAIDRFDEGMQALSELFVGLGGHGVIARAALQQAASTMRTATDVKWDNMQVDDPQDFLSRIWPTLEKVHAAKHQIHEALRTLK